MKYKPAQEVVLYGTDEVIRIPEIKVRYNKGKTHVKIDDNKTACEFLKKVYGRDISVQEQFIVLYVDVGLNFLGYYKHSIGTISSTVADIPMLLGIALKSHARGMIISHNHPSGNPKPSNADKELTKRFEELTKLHKIALFDHLIITKDNGYYSFMENGEISELGQLQGESSIEEQLRSEIFRQLNRVTPSNAPRIYNLLQTPGGYANMEQRMINLVVRDKITPSACIPQIENEL